MTSKPDSYVSVIQRAAVFLPLRLLFHFILSFLRSLFPLELLDSEDEGTRTVRNVRNHFWRTLRHVKNTSKIVSQCIFLFPLFSFHCIYLRPLLMPFVLSYVYCFLHFSFVISPYSSGAFHFTCSERSQASSSCLMNYELLVSSLEGIS